MNLFSYKLDHDYGLAPNPFWGFMSLAVCKGRIRSNKNLQIGDWVIATGGKNLGFENCLIYAMKVEQIIPFDDYWNNPNYGCKIPIMNGTLAQMYGDNFYHTLEDGGVVQEPSAHSNPDFTINRDHTDRDTNGKYVLISKDFFYFGDNAPVIPPEFKEVICKGRDIVYHKIPMAVRIAFIDWVKSNFSKGIHGDPISWRNFKLPKLNIFQYED